VFAAGFWLEAVALFHWLAGLLFAFAMSLVFAVVPFVLAAV
jgi:hypothetical protein